MFPFGIGCADANALIGGGQTERPAEKRTARLPVFECLIPNSKVPVTQTDPTTFPIAVVTDAETGQSYRWAATQIGNSPPLFAALRVQSKCLLFHQCLRRHVWRNIVHCKTMSAPPPLPGTGVAVTFPIDRSLRTTPPPALPLIVEAVNLAKGLWFTKAPTPPFPEIEPLVSSRVDCHCTTIPASELTIILYVDRALVRERSEPKDPVIAAHAALIHAAER